MCEILEEDVFPTTINTASTFKCSHEQCSYGPKGKKSFKKEAYLQNHMKNVHEEKVLRCGSCNAKFAFEWQLKYHCKFCGCEFRCTSCHKLYHKPMSLLMHCKRSGHSFPEEEKFSKLRSSNISDSAKQYLLFPIITNGINNSNQKVNRQLNLISLPLANFNDCRKTIKKSIALHDRELRTTPPLDIGSQTQSNDQLSCEKSSEIAALSAHNTVESKRSTECQTARKRNRSSAAKFDVKSIQTQTLHSSFDAVAPNNDTRADRKCGEKCSSVFTQTFIDDFERSDLIMRDTFLTNEMQYLEQSTNSTEFAEFGNVAAACCSTIETQTSTAITHFGCGNELAIVDNASHNVDGDFQLPDFEFIDIETQTIWNYDRTTQTDDNSTFENSIMDL